jgi:predicted lipoprotein with Yx(FWY)xxD motif
MSYLDAAVDHRSPWALGARAGIADHPDTSKESAMRRIHKLAVPTVVAAAAFIAAACGSNGASGDPYGQAAPTTANPTYGQSPPSAAPAAGQTAPSLVAVAGSPLGQLIVDGSGRSLYLFEGDTTNASTCYDACAEAWPPLLTVGSPDAGPNVSHPDLATATRRDGAVQVTYHGHPLYSFVGDKHAGDTNGQGLTAFGASWYVVGADGTTIDNS